VTARELRIDVVPPYRLNLTVAVLRRLSTNVVDVLSPDGTYVRALGEGPAPAIVAVRALGDGALGVRVSRAGARAAGRSRLLHPGRRRRRTNRLRGSVRPRAGRSQGAAAV